MTAMHPDVGGEPPLPHGFTIERLNAIAGISARGSMWGYPPYPEKFDLARFAIIEHLYTCAEHLDTHDNRHPCNLLRVGQQAIDRHVKQHGAFRGIAVGRDGYTTGDALLKYQVFWTSTVTPTRSPEEPVVDTLALRQIWRLLEPNHQRYLLALAIHEDYAAAAQALGVTHRTVVQTVHHARKLFLWYWHQHETPSRVWGADHRRHPKLGATYRATITTRTLSARKRYHKRRRQQTAGPARGAASIADVRAWAMRNGLAVAARGPIKPEVTQAFTNATGLGVD